MLSSRQTHRGVLVVLAITQGVLPKIGPGRVTIGYFLFPKQQS